MNKSFPNYSYPFFIGIRTLTNNSAISIKHYNISTIAIPRTIHIISVPDFRISVAENIYTFKFNHRLFLILLKKK